MKREEAAAGLRRLGLINPMLAGLMKTKPSREDPRTQLMIWADMLTKYDKRLLDRVIRRYESGEISMRNEAYIGGDIAAELGRLQSRCDQRFRQEQLYYDKQCERARDTKRNVPGVAIALAKLRAAGIIDREEESARLDDLFAWEKGGERPDWLEDRK